MVKLLSELRLGPRFSSASPEFHENIVKPKDHIQVGETSSKLCSQ